MEQTVYSVSQINLLLKELLEQVPLLRDLYIRGEISNYKMYPSGHHYFTLKDAEGALRCVMFKSNAMQLKFRPENGMKVIAQGRIAVFPRDGTYQLYCSRLSPDGIGDLHVAFEQLKQRLYEQGLFAQEHKRVLPAYPQRIVVITSPAGAAIHDMIRILRRRYPLAKVLLLPVRVQGVEAPAEIAGALRYANQQRLGDVIIVGRGGGSLEDLWAFNDEKVARAIFDSEIPVISAVGHEPDVTIADYVADRRASTPSNAAEIAVPDQAALRAWLIDCGTHMTKLQQKRLENLRSRFENLRERRVLQDPSAYVADKQVLLDYLRKNMTSAIEKRLAEDKQRFAAVTSALNALSPLSVLSRGYSVLRQTDGRWIRSVRDVEPGQQLQVLLDRGSLLCTVDEKREEDHGCQDI